MIGPGLENGFEKKHQVFLVFFKNLKKCQKSKI